MAAIVLLFVSFKPFSATRYQGGPPLRCTPTTP